MAATIAAVYPHMNQIGGDGFWLVREPSGRVRALMAAGPRRRQCAAASSTASTRRSRRAGRSRRSPCRARSPAGCWRSRPPSAHGGRLPLPDLLAPAIRHATDGYVVTRSQARLTAEKLAELKDVPGFAPTFLVDGKPPEAGADAQATGARGDARSSRPCRARRFLPRRCRARDRRRSRSHRQPGDARRPRALPGEPRRAAVGRARGRHALQHAAADARSRLADHPRAVRAPARAEAESFDHVHGLSRRPSAPSRCAIASSPIPLACRSRSSAISMPKFLDARSAQDRPPQGRALAARPTAKATRSGWAPPTPRASSSPTSSRSIGSSAPASCCRAPAC